MKGLKRHALALLNVVVHPADIQNRDGGCAGRYDCSRSIERIFANGAYAGCKMAMAAIIIHPHRHDPHHDQLKPLRRVLTCMAVENISVLPSVDHGASGAGVHLRLLRKLPKNNRRDFAHLGH
jgi:hypothetical protein